jgi:hypothetical protein
MNLVYVDNVVSAINFLYVKSEMLMAKFYCSDDDDPSNNYRDV